MAKSKISKNGKIIIYNKSNKNNRKINIKGGFAPKLKSLFNYPRGIAINNTGYIFVVDSDNHCIRIFSPNPEYTLIHTIGVPKKSGNTSDTFLFPVGIAIDQHNAGDILYVSDTYNNRIQLFLITINANNTITATHLPAILGSANSIGKVSFKGNTHETFNNPTQIAIDNNILYVADTANNRIQVFHITINYIHNTIMARLLPAEVNGNNSIFGLTHLNGKSKYTSSFKPQGVAVHNNILYVADSNLNRILVFQITINDNNTITSLYLPSLDSAKYSIRDTTQLAIHSVAGNNILYVLGTKIRIYNISINNESNTITSTLYEPNNITIDIPSGIAIHDNILYLTNLKNDCIDVFKGNTNNPDTLEYYDTIPHPNPRYAPLKEEIEQLQSRISVLEQEIYSLSPT